MIAKLWGRLDQILDDGVVIDVHGVGYHAYCSGRTLGALPAAGSTVELYVETHVREDHIHLFGFVDEAEREWFKLLQTVQGVGARVALALLAVIGPGDMAQVIAAQDKAALTQASGVGGKLAARIISELKGAVGNMVLGPVAAIAAAEGAGATTGDAVSALINLGYGRGDVVGAVATASRNLGGDAGLEDLIRAGLRELAQ
jgi:Holliday junction DNA helicase RuvA